MPSRYLIPELGVAITVTSLVLALLTPLCSSEKTTTAATDSTAPSFTTVKFTAFKACTDNKAFEDQKCLSNLKSKCTIPSSDVPLSGKDQICKGTAFAENPTKAQHSLIWSRTAQRDYKKKMPARVAVGMITFIVLAVFCQIGAVTVHLVGTTSKIMGVTLDHIMYISSAAFAVVALVTFFWLFKPDTVLAWPKDTTPATDDVDSDDAAQRDEFVSSLDIGGALLITGTVASILLVVAVRKFT